MRNVPSVDDDNPLGAISFFLGGKPAKVFFRTQLDPLLGFCPVPESGLLRRTLQSTYIKRDLYTDRSKEAENILGEQSSRA